jgi:hypothetical protein
MIAGATGAAVSTRTRGRRPFRRRSRATSPKRARRDTPVTPGGNPLIHPTILEINRQLASGRLDWAEVPCPDLLPFLQSLDLSALAQAIFSSPEAYWQPLVAAQIGHLLRLRNREAAWKELGWQVEVDDERGIAFPPKETGRVCEHLYALVDAHVGRIFPNHRIAPCEVPKRSPGPKGIENLHPFPSDVARAKAEAKLHDPGERPKVLVDHQTLYCDFKVIHAQLKGRSSELRSRRSETPDEAAHRIELVVREVLDAWGPVWSALRKPVHLTRLNYDDLQGAMNAMVQTYWDVDVSDLVRILLGDRMPPRLKNAGRAAYVASALLGLLLREESERVYDAAKRVYDAVENHRRAHHQGGQRRPQQ